jgi:hypothetical protein
MSPRFVVAALCVLGPLTSVAYGGNIHGEATYVSFSVPGALGTYPMGINASIEVTGYYYASSTQRGFLREADGTITTFAVEGATSTVPESINAAGDITGYYTKPLVYTKLGFLRYADGQIITFDTNQTNGQLGFLPAGINDFGEIAGNYVYHGSSAATRSRAGVFSSLTLGSPSGPVGTATALNASGSVVGYYNGFSFFTGFVVHPDGYWAEIQLPGDPDPACSNQIFPDAINAAGTIAGFFTKNYFFNPSCGPNTTGGFVVSPEGEVTLFEAPGPIPLFDDHDQDDFLAAPHWISIDQAGDIAGSYTLGLNGDRYHGFVRNAYGTITSFDPPEGAQTHVTGINDGGAITGYYSYPYMGGFQPPVGFIRLPQ